MVWPTLRGIYLSFTKFNLLTPAEFNGLDNYVRMVQDPVFWNAMKVTIYYVILNIGLQTVFALVIAVMMQRLTKRTWLRGIVLTPYLVSNVVAAMVFLWILDYQLGIGNRSWRRSGSTGSRSCPPRPGSSRRSPLINVWRHVGYTALLIFAGLQTIPETDVRGRPGGRRRRGADVPQHHRAAAAADPRAGADHHGGGFVPGVRHGRHRHPRRARSTRRGCSSTTSTTSRSGDSSSVMPPRCRSRCCSSW